MVFSGLFTKLFSKKTPQEPEQSCQAEMYADTFYNYEADTDVVSVARMLVDSFPDKSCGLSPCDVAGFYS